MEKLAELLNKLLNKWWKPRNREKTLHIDCYDKCKWLNYKWVHLDGWFMNEESRTLRELIARDSWLWQFVCEKELIFIPEWEIPHVERNYIFDYEWYDISDFQYWLMVWALLKEDEIEQFLIDNIKI